MVEGPCLGCKERHELCHSDCEKFKAYRAEIDRIREVERRYKADHFGITDTFGGGKRKWS